MRWTEEQRAYLRGIVAGRSYAEITDLMNARFGDLFTRDMIKNAINRYKLNTGRTGCFEKGHVPANKGTKGLTGANSGSFKKGNMPQSHRPVGTESLRADGYIWVKVAEPNKWREKHRLLWEEHHGPIPKGKGVMFVDGDRLNVHIDNLVLVDNSVRVRINQMQLAGKGPEITESAIALATLKNKIGEAKRRTKGNN